MEQDGDPNRSDSYGASVVDVASDSTALPRVLKETQTEVETLGSNCCVVDEIPVLHCGRTLWFILQAKDKFFRYRTRGGDPIEVRITNADQPDRVCPSRVKDMANGTYRILWRTNQPGHHNVSIKVRGKHIVDSPFGVDVHERQSPAPQLNGTSTLPSTPVKVEPIGPDSSFVASPQVGIAKKQKKKQKQSAYQLEGGNLLTLPVLILTVFAEKIRVDDAGIRAVSSPSIATDAVQVANKESASTPALLSVPVSRQRAGSGSSVGSSSSSARNEAVRGEIRARSGTIEVQEAVRSPSIPRMTSTYLPIGRLQPSLAGSEASESDRSNFVPSPSLASIGRSSIFPVHFIMLDSELEFCDVQERRGVRTREASRIRLESFTPSRRSTKSSQG
jgi:hypothetical protein